MGLPFAACHADRRRLYCPAHPAGHAARKKGELQKDFPWVRSWGRGGTGGGGVPFGAIQAGNADDRFGMAIDRRGPGLAVNVVPAFPAVSPTCQTTPTGLPPVSLMYFCELWLQQSLPFRIPKVGAAAKHSPFHSWAAGWAISSVGWLLTGAARAWLSMACLRFPECPLTASNHHCQED